MLSKGKGSKTGNTIITVSKMKIHIIFGSYKYNKNVMNREKNNKN